MPIPVFIALLALVVPYLLLMGTASLGFVAARRQPAPDPPSEWPSVSIVVPTCEDPTHVLQALRTSNYPSDQLEILLPDGQHDENASPDDHQGMTVRTFPVDEPKGGLEELPAPLRQGLEAAQGDVLLRLPTGGDASSGWIRAMVRRCTPDTPVVSGPTVVDHEDLFLPRLHALQRLGALAFTGGASYVGVPVPPGLDNVALHVDASRSAPTAPIDGRRAATFTPAANAAVAVPPVSSFAELVDRQAQWLRRRTQASSWSVRGQAGGLWLLHTMLLACSIGAVALPAWRQPTLVALLGKMGADTVLSLPAANHYDQRGLLRSIVPSELMLVVTLPLAGLWAVLWDVRRKS